METGAAMCSECEATEVIIKKAPKSFCRRCWRFRCEFQFRKRLYEFGRPAKGTVGEVFKPAELVLICYDGSPSSVALINLALNALVFGSSQQGEGPGSGKLPFPFKFAIFVILESERNGSPGVEGRQKQHLQSLLKWTKYAARVSNGVQFPLIASCLEMSLYQLKDSADVTQKDLSVVVRIGDPVNDEPPSDTLPENLVCSGIDELRLPFNEELDNQLLQLRNSLKTKTDDKDFVNILKRNLLCSAAERLQITKVLLPEDQTSLAVKMFSMMSLGRGCQVADEMAFTSSANQGTTLVRPFIDFSDDDLRAYVKTTDDESTDGIVGKGSSKRKIKIDSVERQCDDFITNLQKGYPSTVSTLTRIGSKLQSTWDTQSTVKDGDRNHCRFCKRQCDSDESASTSISGLCYGCQNFVNGLCPGKCEQFKNILGLGSNKSDSIVR